MAACTLPAPVDRSLELASALNAIGGLGIRVEGPLSLPGQRFLSECRETQLWRWIKEMRDVVTLYDTWPFKHG